MSLDHSKTIIKLENISFQYGETSIIEGVNLSIHDGDYLGIIGPNGGGKTTLLKIMLGLLKPSSGTVTLFNIPLSHFHAWKDIGYVPQKALYIDQYFPATVEEVVSMGRFGQKKIFQPLGSDDRIAIQQALEQVGMWQFRTRLIHELSGGQQQRVFIARALAGNPKVLVLDEPTVGVDSTTQHEFYTLLKTLNQEMGLTLVLVSHDLEVVAHETTEVACINKTLLYENNPHEMIAHGNIQALYNEHLQFITHNHHSKK
ncbi:zinc ABC transporter ATP-binding protein [Candidatus Cerribacteria bacterium 'Amazon FNV 2010 28 9']|uniref:Zinc ABC transporter ATP-binding protein n=1 Tax=Candidatus Cerribacteria bacterium 'Amazon FNV 2010 28 9' TaxID=2081795 RepID=A0A317JNB8_9BACT|nr:MAG: zinc ABC transporter ATP-binding protein [Candidatus Cerribacteria bacterium 'Amazon FNV 2010 28 9']